MTKPVYAVTPAGIQRGADVFEQAALSEFCVLVDSNGYGVPFPCSVDGGGV